MLVRNVHKNVLLGTQCHGWLTMSLKTEHEPVFTVKTFPGVPKLWMEICVWLAGAEQVSGTHGVTANINMPLSCVFTELRWISLCIWWQLDTWTNESSQIFLQHPNFVSWCQGYHPIAKGWTGWYICSSLSALKDLVLFFASATAEDNFGFLLETFLQGIFAFAARRELPRYKGTLIVHFRNLTGNRVSHWAFCDRIQPTVQYWMAKQLWKTKMGWSNMACPWETSPSGPVDWESCALKPEGSQPLSKHVNSASCWPCL